MTSLLAVFTSGLLLLAPAAPEPMRATKPDKFPKAQEEPVKPGKELTPPAKRARIFGIGVSFDTSGTLAGVSLKLVLPDSPALRAGLMAGCIVSEINGEATVGRSGYRLRSVSPFSRWLSIHRKLPPSSSAVS